MIVDLYTDFSKRINSTKRPTYVTPTQKNGTLRSKCSITSPEIEFKTMGATCPCDFCYAFIPKYKRYYFVTDWVAEGALWVCRMQEDYLASWKTNIGNTNAYIERCSAESDGYIIDTYYTTNVDIVNTTVRVESQWYNTSTNQGCFIVGVIEHSNSVNSQLGGAITYYALTPAQCRDLITYLTGDQFISDAGFPTDASIIQQISHDTAKILVNPMEFIVSCLWFPFPVNYFAPMGATVPVSVGYWSVSTDIMTGKLVTEENIRIITGCVIPDHPQISRGQYLNRNPFTRLSLEFPPFGLIPLDTATRSNGNTLRLEVNIDSLTGKARLIVNQIDDPTDPDYNQFVLTEVEGMIGCPVQLAQVRNDWMTAGSEAVLAGSSMFSLANWTQGGKETIQHTKNAVDALLPQVKTGGDNGSRLYTAINPRLNVQHILLSPEDNEEVGRPLYAKRVINTLTNGFVKCIEASVDYPCYDDEKRAIHSYLMSGFYWE